MSHSPQLPPPPAPSADHPFPLQALPPPNGLPASNESPAQLAYLLSNTLVENENLKRQLDVYKRRADKADRIIHDLNKFNSALGKSPNHAPSNTPSAQIDENAIKLLILECQERVERAEIKRDELEARLLRMQEGWIEFDRLVQGLEAKHHEARSKFTSLMATKGGELIVVGNGPPMANALAVMRQEMAQQAPLPVQNSRVRQRAGSIDGNAYPPHHAVPGPPPAKRLRAERTLPDGVVPNRPRERRRSQSPPRMQHAGHINGLIHHQTLPHPGAFQAPPTQEALARGHARMPEHEMEDGGLLHPNDARSSHRSPRRRRHSSHSRSHSRASSASLDEMLLEATTEDGRPEDPEMNNTAPQHPRSIPTQAIQLTSRQPSSHHLSPHHPSSRAVRHRSASPDPDREYHVSQTSSHHASRARGATLATSHNPSLHLGSISGPGVAGLAVPSGPGVPGMIDPGQVYHTHTFAPPVTGPPVKKSKLANTLSSGSIGGIGNQASVPSIGVTPSAPTVPGGGFPSTNANGQRICRQCGQPGRYKDGKCVEKWGPGPEGPGTVCDRCRKKMKRVERRGTLDSQQLVGSHSIPHLSATSSQNLMVSNGRNNGHSPLLPHTNADRGIPRTDTVLLDERMFSSARSGPGSHLSANSHRSRPLSPRELGAGSGKNTMRSPPTPPSIATLPHNDVDERIYDQLELGRSPSERAGGATNGRRSRQSTSSLSPPTPGAPGTGAISSRKVSPRQVDSPHTNGNVNPTPNKGKPVSSDVPETDADADADPDADAEMDVDAEAEELDADVDAELLGAVDAAEGRAPMASSASGKDVEDEEWLKKEELSI